jgi:IclR family acetate operon transcriptional repressor
MGYASAVQNNEKAKYPISSVDNALRLLLLYRERRLIRVTDAATELGVGR